MGSWEYPVPRRIGRTRRRSSKEAVRFPADYSLMPDFTFLSRFAPRAGLFTLRQTFVRRCQVAIARRRAIKDDERDLFRPEL